MLSGTEVWNGVCNMWACIILLKDSSWDALKEESDFELKYFIDVPVAIEIIINL